MASRPINQRQIGCRVEQAAAFKLALYFNQHVSDLAQQIHRHRFIIDMGWRFAVTAQLAPENKAVCAVYANLR